MTNKIFAVLGFTFSFFYAIISGVYKGIKDAWRTDIFYSWNEMITKLKEKD